MWRSAEVSLTVSVFQVRGVPREILTDAALEVLGDQRALVLVTSIEERELERQCGVVEERRVLRPGDDGAWRHQRRKIAIGETAPGQVGQRNHRADLGTPLRVPILGASGQYDLDLTIVLQVIQRHHDVPAIHLALIERLRAMVETTGIAKADGIGRGEQPERGMWLDNTALIEQRQSALDFEHALNDEHHVGAAGVVLVEHEGARALQRPREHPRLELRDLFAVSNDDRVLADEIHAAHMPIEVDADAGPVEPGGDLLDVTRFTRAVAALHHHAPVVYESREQRQRSVPIKDVVGIERWHVLLGGGEGRHLEIGVDLEQLTGRDGDIGLGDGD